jgi:hypothetical protein
VGDAAGDEAIRDDVRDAALLGWRGHSLGDADASTSGIRGGHGKPGVNGTPCTAGR